jgi:hypothetical protein
MTTGTEHEYSINDPQFNPLPVSDRIIKAICGCVRSEILFGDVWLGKELQKTVLEFVPRKPGPDLALLEGQVYRGIRKFGTIFGGTYRLLGLGMHPTLAPDSTAVWEHDEGKYYEAYDRLFDIRQHGWLNIQALQINLSYRKERDLVQLFNRTRRLLPYLVAVTASSPVVEGKLTGSADNRLIYYRQNQKEIPAICDGVIPPPIRSVAEYRAAQEQVYAELRARGADILCEEWVNSAGTIIRFSRRCLEIKALDEQECVRSDMAVCAFTRALLRCRTLPVPEERDGLLAVLEDAIREGTAALKPDLLQLYESAWQHATDGERIYLPVILDRIGRGSLAEQIRDRFENEGDIIPVLTDMAMSLRENQPYGFS